MNPLINNNSTSNPYTDITESQRAAKSLAELSKGRFYYVNAETLEIERSHIFRRVYEWIKGFFGGNDMCDQKLASLCLMREVYLLTEVTTLDNPTIDAIATISQNLGLISSNAFPNEKSSQLFRMVMLHQKPHRQAVKKEIENYYHQHKTTLSKYNADQKINSFFNDILKTSTSLAVDSLNKLPPPLLPTSLSDKEEVDREEEKRESAANEEDSLPFETGTGENEFKEPEPQSINSEKECVQNEQTETDSETDKESVEEKFSLSVEPLAFIQDSDVSYTEEITYSKAAKESVKEELEPKTTLHTHTIKSLPKFVKSEEVISSGGPAFQRTFIGVATAVATFAIGNHLGWIPFPTVPTFPSFDLSLSNKLSSVHVTLSSPNLQDIANTIDSLKNRIVNQFWKTAPVKPPIKPRNRIKLDLPFPQEKLHRLQQKNTFLLQWQSFMNAPSPPINDKLFQHVLGTYFGKGTGLEGYNRLIPLNYLHTLTQYKIDALMQYPLWTEDSKLEFCHTFFNNEDPELSLKLFASMRDQLHKASNLTLDLENSNSQIFIEAFNKEVTSLKKGDSFFLQTGWTQHAITLEVIKQPDGQYKFRVYNRGDGLKYYANVAIKEKIHHIPFIEIINISHEAATSFSFLKSIHELIHSYPTGAEDFFVTILPILGGEHSPHLYSIDQAQELLNIGHCTYLSLTAWMSQQLGDQSTYSRWQLEVEFKTLASYFEQNQQRLFSEERVRYLMKEGLSQFSRNALVAYKTGIVTDKELTWIQSQLARIDLTIQEAELKYSIQVTNQAPVVNLSALKKSVFDSFDLPTFWDLKAYEHPIPPTYHSFDFTHWEYEPKSLNPELKNLIKKITDLSKDSDLNIQDQLNLKEGIKTFIDKIPLANNCFWETVSITENKEIVEHLAFLSRYYLVSILDIQAMDEERTESFLFEDFLTQAKILTIADAAIRHFKSELEFEFPSTIQQDILGILNGAYPLIGIHNPKKTDDIRLMLRHWNQLPLDSGYSFFGFEKSKDSKKIFSENDYAPDIPFPDVKFAENWLKNHTEAVTIVNKLYPSQESSPLHIKALFALASSNISDDAQKPLPPEFYDLREIAFWLNYMVNGKWPNIKSELVLPKNPKVSFFISKEKTSDKSWKLNEQFLQEHEAVLSFNLGEKRLKKAQDDIGALSYFVSTTVLQKEDEYAQRKDIRKRISPHSLLIQKIKFPVLNFDGEQEIFALSSRKNLQIEQVLGYFYKYPSRLSIPRYQKMFKFLTTENGLLIDAFLRSPSYAKELSQSFFNLIQQQDTIYKNLNNTAGRLSVIELNNMFNSFILYTQKKYPQAFPGDFKTPFLDQTEDLNSIIADASNAENNRSYACFLKAQAYENKTELQPAEAIELLTALFQLKTFPMPQNDDRWDNSKKTQMRDLTHKLRQPLEDVLKGKNKNSILNAVVKNLTPQFADQKWNIDGSFPQFWTEDRQTVINLFERSLAFENDGILPLPREIRFHPHVASLFAAEDRVLAKQNIDGEFRFKDKQGNPCRVKNPPTENLTVQRKVGNNWYQASYKYRIMGYRSFKLFSEDAVFWFSENQIFVSEDTEGSFKYRIEFHEHKHKHKHEEKYQISNIYRLDANGKDTGEVLADIYSQTTAYDFLQRIEDKSHIRFWKKQTTNEPSFIELPRLGLTFDVMAVNGQRRAYCKQLPDYYLAINQNVKELGDITSYLLLQKDGSKGRVKKTVLMPRLKMKEIIDDPLNTLTNPDFTTNNRYILLDVDQKNQKLKPRSVEARLYLSMMFLWERNYSKAMSYLKGYGTQLKPLTAEDHRMIEWIIQLSSKNSDTTPQAISVKLYALFLEIRDSLNFSKTTFQEKNHSHTLKNTFDNYLQVKDQLGILKLDPEDELFLLNSVDKNTVKDLFIRYNPQEFKKYFPHLSLLPPGPVSSKIDLPPGPESSKRKIFAYENEEISGSRLRRAFITDDKNTLAPSILKNPFPLSLREQLLKTIYDKNYSEISDLLLRSLLPNEVDLIPLDQREEEAKRLLGIISSRPISTEERKTEERVLALYLGEILHNPTDKLWDLACDPLASDPRRPYLFFSKQNFRNVTTLPSSRDSDPIQQTPIFSHFETRQNKGITPEFLTSLDQKDLFLFKKPIVDNIQSYVTALPNLSEQLDQQAVISQDLQNLFNITTGDNVADRKFQELRTNISSFESSQKGIKTSYTLNDLNKLRNLRETLKTTVDKQSQILLLKEESILELANKPFDDAVLQAEKQIRLSGGLETPLNMLQLIQLFRLKDAEKYHSQAQALSRKEIDILDQEIRDYLILATFQQQHQRVIDKIDEIEQTILPPQEQGELLSKFVTLMRTTKNYILETFQQQLGIELASDQKKQELLRQFVELAQATRNYEIQDHPEYLALEYQANILIRPGQAANQLLISDYKKREGSDQYNGAAVEAIPGSGKTSVHLTLQALSDADGEHLAVVVMPERLMPQMADELQQRLGNAYNQLVEIMSFDRDDAFNVPRLGRILDRFNAIIKNKKVLLITDSSVQSLILKFIEKTLTPPQNLHEIAIFREILTILRSKGFLTLDEMHEILNVLQAYHFTLGLSFPINEEVAIATSDFYILIATHPEIQKRIGFNFLHNRGDIPFDPNKYKEEIQPIIIKAILNGKIGKHDDEIHGYFQSLKPEEKKLLSSYLSNEKNAAASSYVNDLPSMRIKNLLAVLKEETSRIFPLTAKKEHDKHYGKIPVEAHIHREDTELAIPYHGSKNPMIKSQFGTELEIINYTIQMHLNSGISKHIILKEINKIKDIIEQEITKKTINKIEDSSSYPQFTKLCGKEKLPLFKLSEKDLDIIRDHVNNHPEVQIDLITRYILPQIKRYSQQLHSSGQIYAPLFNLVRGFGGTLWNVEAYPNIFYEVFSSDAVAETLFILMENKEDKVEVIHMYNPTEVNQDIKDQSQNMVKAIYGATQTPKGSFVDSADLFSSFITDHDEPNEVIAKYMLDYLPSSKKGVGYFTKDDKLNVIIRNQDAGVPISQCGLSNEEMEMYFDFQHTFGADAKLALKATATITIGQHTMLYNLVQAVWRMRQLGKGQTVNFAVSAEDEQVIREVLKKIYAKEVGDSLTVKDLFIYTMYNQAIRQGDDNHRSLKQKMDTLLITKVLEMITDPSVSSSDLVTIVDQTKNLFVLSTLENPYEQYGVATDYAPKKVVIEEEVSQFMKSNAMQAFKTNPVLSKRYTFKDIEQSLKLLVNKEIVKLPDTLLTSTQYSQEVAVALSTKMDTQTKTETHQEIAVETAEKKYRQAPPILNWTPEILFLRNTFAPTSYNQLTKTPILKEGKINAREILFNDMAKEVSFDIKAFLDMNISPNLQISDMLHNMTKTIEYADIFDSDLLSTLNMMPVYKQNESDIFRDWPIYEPFSKYEDISSHYVLIVKDIQTNHKKIILLDQEDASQLENLLNKNRIDPFEGDREVHLGLYNLATEKLLETSLENFADEALQDQHSRDLLVQAKFFKGFLSYSKKEKEVLRKWIEEKDPQHMKKFFLNMVLNNKPSTKINFPGSDISKLFDEFDL